ncbi:MAG: Gar1/Naf1 family protein [Candidatus Hydrothermarchaeales archaeon]
MRPLGKITSFTKSGAILLRSIEIPSLYSTVVTKDLKKVGTVKDVFGPSSKPYVLIKPMRKFGRKDLLSLKNEALYEVRGGKSKRRRKDGGEKGRLH